MNPKNIIVKILTYFLSKFVKKKLFTTKGMLREKQSIFLENIGKLIAYTYTLDGYAITAGEIYRTNEQQAIYWAKKLTKVRYSKHQSRLAFDIHVFINGIYQDTKEKQIEAYKPLAVFWKSLHPNNISGYDWGWDFNHFQMT